MSFILFSFFNFPHREKEIISVLCFGKWGDSCSWSSWESFPRFAAHTLLRKQMLIRSQMCLCILDWRRSTLWKPARCYGSTALWWELLGWSNELCFYSLSAHWNGGGELWALLMSLYRNILKPFLVESDWVLKEALLMCSGLPELMEMWMSAESDYYLMLKAFRDVVCFLLSGTFLTWKVFPSNDEDPCMNFTDVLFNLKY